MYERTVDGQDLTFGVSGELYNSDLLMYDRQSDSRWDQISGVAVIGSMTGKRMEVFPSMMMTWADWRVTYPDSEVLSRFTGYMRDYDGYPYRGYFGSDELWQPVANSDSRLSNKVPVTGVTIDEQTYVAYVDEDVVAHSPINDSVDGSNLLIVADPESGSSIAAFNRTVLGQTLTFVTQDGHLIDQETGSTWSYTGESIDGALRGQKLERFDHLSLFWFAWAAFHPDTALWSPD